MAEYHNPQHDPTGSGGMNSGRMIVVFVVAFVLLVISQQYLLKQKPASPSTQEATKQQTAQQSVAQQAPAPVAPVVSAAGSKQATAETETVVENDLFKITFTNRGGRVKSWILKKYKDERGNPLELVHVQAAEKHGWPLSFWTWDAQLKDKLNSALYVADTTGAVTAPHAITFEFADGDVNVRKTFSFDNTYVIRVQTSVQRGGSYVTALPAWPGGFGDATAPASYAGQTIDYAVGDKIERLKVKKISSGNVISSPISWGGAIDQYFATIFLPDNPQQAVLANLRNSLEIPKDPRKPEGDKIKVEVLGAAAGSMNAPTSMRVFAGPKAVDVLESVRANGLNGEPNAGGDLRQVVDFGMFSFIARPLFGWAKWTQQHWVPNWGWAIIFLTIIINLVLLPLRIASMKSALKMQKVAPQIKAIQEKYKKYKLNDPRRAEANTEVAAVYKQHGINPAGGCLPMVIQLPFLFAFYAMLSNAIELRQARWLWLPDLSAPDKLFILPVLIVVTMLIMQRITPTGGMSAEQQRMMNLMMPLMVGLMSWSVASGLGLYWVTGTIVGIFQQMIMNRTELGREMRAAMDKQRARKK